MCLDFMGIPQQQISKNKNNWFNFRNTNKTIQIIVTSKIKYWTRIQQWKNNDSFLVNQHYQFLLFNIVSIKNSIKLNKVNMYLAVQENLQNNGTYWAL